MKTGGEARPVDGGLVAVYCPECGRAHVHCAPVEGTRLRWRCHRCRALNDVSLTLAAERPPAMLQSV